LFDAHLKMASLNIKSSTCQKTVNANRFSLVSTHDNLYRPVTLEKEEMYLHVNMLHLFQHANMLCSRLLACKHVSILALI
jgi:hypothetical protein